MSFDRVLVIGLDGATFKIIDPLIQQDELPNFKKLKENGASGKLRSTTLPLSPSAWSSFLTGNWPGKHNIFDFQVREKNSYRRRPINSQDRKELEIWDILGKNGLTTGVINVPCTYPPEDIEGFMISGYPSPEDGSHVKPDRLYEELAKKFGQINLQHEEVYSDRNIDSFLKDQYRCWEKTEEIFDYLSNSKEWDVLLSVFKPTDDLFHGVWKYIDDESFPEVRDEKYREAALKIYKKADKLLGKLIETMDEETLLLVVSDHGFGPTHSTVYMNNWLKKKGYLKLKDGPLTKIKSFLNRLGLNPKNVFRLATKLRIASLGKQAAYEDSFISKLFSKIFLSFEDVDWERTKAFSAGNLGQIYINKKGREPQGTVTEEEYPKLLNKLEREIKSIEDPRTGEEIFDDVLRGHDVYQGRYSQNGPDLIFHDKNFEYTTFQLFEFGSDEIVSEQVIDRSGEHKPLGIFMAYGDMIENEEIQGEIVDLVPTILYSLNLPIPKKCDGKILKEIFSPSFESEERFKPYEERETKSEGKEEAERESEIKKKLRDLGYA